MRALPVLLLLAACGEEPADDQALGDTDADQVLFVDDGDELCARAVYVVAFDVDGASCLNPANPDCCELGFAFVGSTVEGVVCVETL